MAIVRWKERMPFITSKKKNKFSDSNSKLRGNDNLVVIDASSCKCTQTCATALKLDMQRCVYAKITKVERNRAKSALSFCEMDERYLSTSVLKYLNITFNDAQYAF